MIALRTDYICTGDVLEELIDRLKPIMAIARVAPEKYIIIRRPDEVWIAVRRVMSQEYDDHGKLLPALRHRIYLMKVTDIQNVHTHLTTAVWK